MGKNHYEKFHKNEKRIKKCLRCIVNEQATIIGNQNEQITDLEHILDKKECKIENLMDEIRNLKNDLKIALERKDYYKDKYYRDKK